MQKVHTIIIVSVYSSVNRATVIIIPAITNTSLTMIPGLSIVLSLTSAINRLIKTMHTAAIVVLQSRVIYLRRKML